MKLFDVFKPKYLNWNEYQKKVAFLDEFNFQQDTRKENIKQL